MKQLKKFSAPQIVTDNTALQEMVTSLLNESFVTIDTEFVRERTYWPDLCLIQIAGAGSVYLIDTLSAEIDLSLLVPLLSAQEIIKVFHAAQQDLEIFLHIFGFLPAPVFDTQIAAMVMGFGNQVGYDGLVESVLGYRIDKSHRFSDWSIRPLTKAQQDYAAADVTYLWDVYQLLLKKIQMDNRLGWVTSEMALLTDPDFFLPPIDKMWKRLGTRIKNERSAACLYALLQWREEEAQRLNIPRQRLIKDECLQAIAASLPDNIKALEMIRGVSGEFAKGKEGASLLTVIKRVKNTDIDFLDVPLLLKVDKEKPSEALVSLLKVLLLANCETYKVAPKLVASSQDIERLALGERDLEILSGWRKEVFGQDALDLCHGNLMVKIQDKKVKFVKH